MKNVDKLQVVSEMVMFECKYGTGDYIRVHKDSKNEVMVSLAVDYGEETQTVSNVLSGAEAELFKETLVLFFESMNAGDKEMSEKEVVICPESDNTKLTIEMNINDLDVMFRSYGHTVILGLWQLEDIISLLDKKLVSVPTTERVIGGGK